jgi:outer membrane biosynthesis protein TonB
VTAGILSGVKAVLAGGVVALLATAALPTMNPTATGAEAASQPPLPTFPIDLHKPKPTPTPAPTPPPPPPPTSTPAPVRTAPPPPATTAVTPVPTPSGTIPPTDTPATASPLPGSATYAPITPTRGGGPPGGWTLYGLLAVILAAGTGAVVLWARRRGHPDPFEFVR